MPTLSEYEAMLDQTKNSIGINDFSHLPEKIRSISESIEYNLDLIKRHRMQDIPFMFNFRQQDSSQISMMSMPTFIDEQDIEYLENHTLMINNIEFSVDVVPSENLFSLYVNSVDAKDAVVAYFINAKNEHTPLFIFSKHEDAVKTYIEKHYPTVVDFKKVIE